MNVSTRNFLTGLAFGLAFGLVFVYFCLTSHLTTIATKKSVHRTDQVPLAREDFDKIRKMIIPVEFKDSHSHNDDDRISQRLEHEVRVLCWVMTSPRNLQRKAIHVQQTWTRRCNKVLFISSVTNDSFPAVGVGVPEGREHLTGKTMKALRYIFEHHFDDADWFMKADDDTYVILENLRYFLSGQNKDEPVYFRHHFQTVLKKGFYSGGAGYVISKEALRRFGAQGHDASLCTQDGDSEDVLFAACMDNLGVKFGNSSDKFGRSRFHCFGPESHLLGLYPNWYHSYDSLGARKGPRSISDYAISFHDVPPEDMYTMEFFIYHLRPYGINLSVQDLNTAAKP